MGSSRNWKSRLKINGLKCLIGFSLFFACVGVDRFIIAPKPTYADYIQEYSQLPYEKRWYKLKEMAHTIKLNETELNEIKSRYKQHEDSLFLSIDNTFLAYVYGTILNRYENKIKYQQNNLIAEYILEGKVKKEQVTDGFHLNFYFTVLYNIKDETKEIQKETVHKLVKDLSKVLTPSQLEEVHTESVKWLHKKPKDNLEVVQQLFFQEFQAQIK